MAAYRKAVVAFVLALLGALAYVITGHETLADVTTAEWIGVGIAVFGSPALVYATPNTPKGL